ncbi:MAG: helix-turn-helix domain-containing protein [Rhodobacterales bacterium]|nr:helix-turn-helix domain-containing protein [Rhodobacterales bacterium]
MKPIVVVIVLESGTSRFSELRRIIGGVSERMLARTLMWLEAAGLVLRVAHDVVPPHFDYSLSPVGREVAVHMRNLADWIDTLLQQIARTWETRAARGADCLRQDVCG